MNYQNRYFVKKLNEVFELRRCRNANYSIRSFARDLDVSKSTLYEVLRGRRPLPVKFLNSVLDKLESNPIERTLFSESLYRTKVKLDEIEIEENSITERHLINDSHFKIIIEWEHYAVLSLIDVDDFQSEEDYIAKRLGISEERVKTVLENLTLAGFIKRSDGQIRTAVRPLATTEDISSEVLKKAHFDALDMSKEKLNVDVNKRDYSTITLAINSQRIPEAKAIIREFRKKMKKLLSDGSRDEVYQIAIQMYPLTEIDNEEKL